MENKIFKLMVKYPFAFLFTGISLFIPYSMAIVLFDWKPILSLNLGWLGIIIFGAMFHIIIILLWWFISYIIGEILSMPKRINKNEIEMNLIYTKWDTIITIGSFVSGLFAFLFLMICYFFDLGMKMFFLLSFFIPLFRILFAFCEFIHFSRKKI